MSEEQTFRRTAAQASAPKVMEDQHGRRWSRWFTLIPNDYRLCGKCGKRIQVGYVLEPHITIAICPEHVQSRWL